MTVSSTTVRNIFAGDGSQATFVYTYKIFADTDIKVIIRSAAGTETIKTLTTDYTVTGAGTGVGGNVVFNAGKIPTNTETVVLIRDVPQTQAIDYIANDPFPAETHEEGLDRATMTTQQIQEELDRSFKVSRTNTIADSEFTTSPTLRAGTTLGFDADGNLTTVADFLPAGGDSALFQFSSTTADADPGAGFFRLNNATLASVSKMFIDDLEYNGTDVSSWIQSWDDVVNASDRGRVRITKAQSLDTWIVFRVSGTSVDNSGYTTVNLTYLDSNGTLTDKDKTWISFSPSGSDGSIPGYYYDFDSNTADSDPGAGEVKFNNGTYSAVSKIFINDEDGNGGVTTTDVLSWGASTSTDKGYIMIYDINDRSTYVRFKTISAVTDNTGYNTIAVAFLASNNTFTNGDELSITFVRNGDTGDAATIAVGTVGATTVGVGGSATAGVTNGGNSGAASFNFTFGIPTGATGATGATGTASGLAMTWNSSTSDADPGSGKLAFNNGTVSSVNKLFIDDADDTGTSIASFINSWDAISNANNTGVVTIVKEGTASTYAMFTVTGAVTANSGYSTVAVTHIVSNGSFTNLDGIGVHFAYSGSDGEVSLNGVQTLTNKSLVDPIMRGDGSSADGKIILNCSQNTHGIKVQSPPHSAAQDYTLILPQNVGTSGQVLATNGSNTNQTSWVNATETKPTVANVSQTIPPATATTINITGTNFVSIPQVQFINGSTGAVTNSNTVSFTNATTLSVNVTLATGNYFVRIENPDGNAGRSTNNIITASAAPSFTTAAGSLGIIAGNFSGTVFTVVGSSDSAISFTETTSVLVGSGGSQANCSLASNGVITTSDFGGSSTTPTTYNFTLRITDAEGQTVDRDFSLTSSFGATGGGQFN